MVFNKKRPSEYSALQKILHWAIFLCILLLMPIGLFMKERGEKLGFDALTSQLYIMHKSVGFIFLLLVIARVVLLFYRGKPKDVESPRYQVIAAEAVHGMLYLLLLFVPIVGWMGASAYGARGILGGFELPEIIAKNTLFAESLFEWHESLAMVLVFLAFGHIVVALWHYFVKKDGVLQRMLPRRFL